MHNLVQEVEKWHEIKLKLGLSHDSKLLRKESKGPRTLLNLQDQLFPLVFGPPGCTGTFLCPPFQTHQSTGCFYTSFKLMTHGTSTWTLQLLHFVTWHGLQKRSNPPGQRSGLRTKHWSQSWGAGCLDLFFTTEIAIPVPKYKLGGQSPHERATMQPLCVLTVDSEVRPTWYYN